MKAAVTFLCSCFMLTLNQSCTEKEITHTSLQERIRDVVVDYINKSDSISIKHDVILLEQDSVINDTSYYRLKTIISKGDWNKLPSDTLMVNNSCVLLGNVDWRNNDNESVQQIIEGYLSPELKVYNPMVWQIKSIGDTLLVDKQFGEIPIAIPAIKFDPPVAN
ncbi:MAG TPA: hypothetical protein VEB40_15755 [Flavipsychrobacter sp.]|nr:hypothetical protein [Flavipsychrobacter sp.]